MFGEVAVGSNVVGKVVLRNEGSATVSVSRVKACCGAKAELSAMKIPPNGCECCQSLVQRLVEDGSPHQAMLKQQRAIHLRQGFATLSVSFAEEHS